VWEVDRDRRGRRAVANDLRRKIERDALIAGAAEELAQAVEATLSAAERQQAGLDAAASLADLRAALSKFRDATGRE
jgi:hypothetical protein